MTLEEIEADEVERFGDMIGTTISAYAREDDTAINETQIKVESVMTEKELVESEGFEYLRLPIQDHTWPTPDELNVFIDFARNADNAWLHFHCQAGNGRTGILMMVYDMMKNPDVAFEDIMLRHAMTGSNYLPYADPKSDIADVYILRAKRIRQVYDYIQEMNGNYTIPWSEWVAQKDS